jgi:hypothetical protein
VIGILVALAGVVLLAVWTAVPITRVFLAILTIGWKLARL